MSELIQQCNEAITIATMKLMRSSNLAFDISVLLNLKRKFTDDPDMIIAVSNTTLLVNPKRFLEENINDQQFMLRHEAWHVIGFDMLRAKGKDANIWNEACDYWINNMIYKDRSYSLDLPDGCLYSKQFNDWDKEKIYEYLLCDNQGSNDSKYSGDLRDPSDESTDGGNEATSLVSEEEVQKDLEELVAKSAIQAKAAGGDIPADIQDYLDELYNPKLNWRKILMKYLNTFVKHDYTYKKPNRRFLHQGIILPSAHSEQVGTIHVAIDESMSVSTKDFEIYIGGIEEIQKALNPEKIEVLGFTTKIVRKQTITSNRDIELLMSRTYGGTDVRCVFKHIAKNNIRPNVLIVFSDMETDFPPKPSYDVIWICINNPSWKAPNYGKVIYVNQ